MTKPGKPERKPRPLTKFGSLKPHKQKLFSPIALERVAAKYKNILGAKMLERDGSQNLRLLHWQSIKRACADAALSYLEHYTTFGTNYALRAGFIERRQIYQKFLELQDQIAEKIDFKIELEELYKEAEETEARMPIHYKIVKTETELDELNAMALQTIRKSFPEPAVGNAFMEIYRDQFEQYVDYKEEPE